MADDSMEISSEHGHNDGDIDIDFDFTPAQVDEDYVLEDATLNADFGDDHRLQPSSAIGNDDLMIDEDVDSYPMDDAVLLHGEEGQAIDHEALHFDNDDSRYLGDNLNADLHFEGEDVNSAAEYMYTNQQSTEAQTAINEAAEEYSGNAPQDEGVPATELISVPGDENPPADVVQHESRETSPLQASPKSSASPQLPKTSPSAFDLDGGSNSKNDISGHSETNITSPFLSGDGIKAVEATSLDTAGQARAQDVIVVYRSVEYALFSTSELDDPDSFFLSDTSIAEKPLSELFKAIRLVIQEELTDEDELCIAVEDLGIETDEVSCTKYIPSNSTLSCMQQASTVLYDVTLAQIVNLRESLLRNDGVEISRPLCLLLGTKTHFSKRIEKLTAGAAEGKGLSQYVNWDEQSESIDDLEKANENEIAVEPTTDSDEVQNVPGNQDLDAPQPDDTDHDSPEELAQENEYEHEPELEHSEAEAPEHVEPSASSVSGDLSIQHHSATDDNPSTLQNSTEKGSPSNEFYDEDELIDYSEEEGDSAPTVQRQVKEHSNDESRSKQGTLNLFPPCLKPSTCFCSKCCALLLAEYEAINEDLRRRSLSRTTEDKVPEPSNEQPPLAAEGDQGGANVGENSVQNEEKSEQLGEDQNSDLNAAYDDFTTGEFDATESLEQYNGAGLSVNEFGGEGEFTGDSAFGDSFHMFGTEAQEYDYGDQGTLEDDDFHHQFQDNEIEYPGADATEAKPQQIDTAESSVTVDADEIQYEDGDEVNDEAETGTLDKSKIVGVSHETQTSILAEHEDEIGYDEEDGFEKQKESEIRISPSADPIMPSSNGKRSRAETESDDAKSMRGNGTYWPLRSKRRRY